MGKQDGPVTATDDSENDYSEEVDNLFDNDSFTKCQRRKFVFYIVLVAVGYVILIGVYHCNPSLRWLITELAKAVAALSTAVAALEDWTKNRVKDELERYNDSRQHGIKQSERYQKRMNKIQLRKGILIVIAFAAALLSIS